MYSHGLVLAMGLVLGVSSVQSAILYDLSPTDVYTTGVASATTVNFNDGTCGSYVSCTGDYLLATGFLSGRYASPYGINDRYLSVPRDRSDNVLDQVTMVLDGSYDYFGLYWGSVDTYNSILFYLDGSLVDSFTGADLVPLLANGGQSSWASNRYVNFFFTDDSSFDTVVLASSNYAFESDNHAYGRLNVPEPATLAILALGMVGLWVSRHRAQAH